MPTVQVRYIVHHVDAAIAFYTTLLGFRLDMHPASPFAMLSRGDLRLVLSASNPMGGGPRAPGFRNQIVTGVGGKQIIVEDPSSNPIELFEPTLAEARLRQ
jgi:hypothetical protein